MWRVLKNDSEEEKHRLDKLLGTLLRADLQLVEEILRKKSEKERKIDAQIENCDNKIFRRRIKRSVKTYNMTQAARILGVHRQTLYYWMKKRLIKPRRDYRDYPVFTVLDIENLIKRKYLIKQWIFSPAYSTIRQFWTLAFKIVTY